MATFSATRSGLVRPFNPIARQYAEEKDVQMRLAAELNALWHPLIVQL